jgi:hypothetical protein
MEILQDVQSRFVANNAKAMSPVPEGLSICEVLR